MNKKKPAIAAAAENQPSDAKTQPRGPSQSTILTEMALESADLFHDLDGNPWAAVQGPEGLETVRVKSVRFRRFLSRRYYQTKRTAPGSQAIEDALAAISGRACFDGPEVEVFNRIAGDDSELIIDLHGGQYAHITEKGWRIVSELPTGVRIFRPSNSRPLPTPKRNNEITFLTFLSLLNLNDPNDGPLVLGSILAAYRIRGPYPIIDFYGQQGSAKTNATEQCRACIDPAEPMTRSFPRDEENLAISAVNSRVIALDNVSTIQPWQSDALCRISTGSGLAKRTLYEDAEETILRTCRPIFLNGINELGDRPDLLSRSLLIELKPLHDEDRLSLRKLATVRAGIMPGVMGFLFDCLSGSIRNLPSIDEAPVTRLADFAEWSLAAEPVAGWGEGAFVQAILRNRATGSGLALEGHPVVAALKCFITTGAWAGTMTDLLKALNEVATPAEARLDLWPKTAKGLGHILHRLAPSLESIGYQIIFSHTGQERRLVISVQKNVINVKNVADLFGGKV